jgi:hypothetical protein
MRRNSTTSTFVSHTERGLVTCRAKAIGTPLPVGLSARWQTHIFTRIWVLEIGLLSCLFQHAG